MTQYVKEKVEKIERPITAWILISCISVLAFMYVFFVAGAIMNAVAAKNTSSEVASVSAAVSDLESKYLAAKSSIDLEYAKSMGFFESKSDTIYIAKKGTSLSLR